MLGLTKMNNIWPLFSKNLLYWFGSGTGMNTSIVYERDGENIDQFYILWIRENVYKPQIFG